MSEGEAASLAPRSAELWAGRCFESLALAFDMVGLLPWGVSGEYGGGTEGRECV